jgi:hypothetical protein
MILMAEYRVYTARYPIERTKYEKGKRLGSVIEMGKLDERGTLSTSINDELRSLGKGWAVKSISMSAVLGDCVFVILFEKA